MSGGLEIAWLRLIGGVVLLVSGTWLVVTTPTPFVVGIAIVAALVAAWWITGFVRARRARVRLLLRLTPEALELVVGERLDRARWSEVQDVAVDEDRLVVRLERRSGEPLVIEPLWRGVGAYALADAIRAAWHASPETAGRSDGSGP